MRRRDGIAQRRAQERDDYTNARPTGGMRQVQYRLVAGEASWALNIDRIVDY